MRTLAKPAAILILAIPACAQVTSFDFNERPRAWANMAPIDGRGTSEWSPDAGRSGGALHVSADKGVPSDSIRMWKTVLSRPAPPAGHRLHVSAWIKGRNVETVAGINVRAGTRGDAYIAGFASSQEEFPLKGTFDWTEVRASLDVPRGAANVQAHVLLVGSGEVWFDDVRVEVGEAVQLIVPGVFVVRGEARVPEGGRSAGVPLPRDDADQSVIGVTILTGQAIGHCRITRADDGASAIEVTADPGTKVSWEAIVLVGPTDTSRIPELVPAPETWPAEAREWTQDAARAVGDLIEIIRAIVQSDAPADHAPRACLARVRAAGIPARLVLGVAPWAPPPDQARAIVEAFLPGFGWYAIEPTLGRGAWPNHQFIRFRIVHRADEDSALASWSGARAEPLRNFPEDHAAPAWKSALAGARASWLRRLQRDDPSALAPDRPLAWFREEPIPTIERLLIGDAPGDPGR